MVDGHRQADHDLLIEIRTVVTGIKEDIVKQNGTLARHSKRIYALEKWRWILGGAISTLGLIVGGKFIFF